MLFPAPSLSLDDLGDVLEETLATSAKWYKIGIRLKVPVDKLDGIRSQFNSVTLTGMYTMNNEV